MKKFMVISMTLALLCTGCASFGTFAPGAQAVVNAICSPSAAQQAEATKWLAVLDNIQAGVSAAFPPVAIVKASSAMTVLRDGGCFILSEVEAALILIADMQARQVALKGLKAAPVSVQVQFPALWATVKGK